MVTAGRVAVLEAVGDACIGRVDVGVDSRDPAGFPAQALARPAKTSKPIKLYFIPLLLCPMAFSRDTAERLIPIKFHIHSSERKTLESEPGEHYSG
jgi:hypothetical protein